MSNADILHSCLGDLLDKHITDKHDYEEANRMLEELYDIAEGNKPNKEPYDISNH
jgi:hypothetical protein